MRISTVSPIFRLGNSDLHGFPLRLQSAIGNIPPSAGETFLTGPGLSQRLFDANDNATDLSVLRVAHQPRPTIENDAFKTSGGHIVLLINGQQVTVDTVGSTDVEVFFEGPNQGNARDDDGDGLDDVAS